ncbi:ADP-forming succinate--CoA ligase subunit beta [Candidatus Zinderia endosymbiont of Aphrophora alni]|uniref:ADP-forming succinate--CoA ligase subunit beta n=1 Tax=Candidatus Zinderia endosymbiont of Aphrophora alni TaxID=3077951 RepID=UPI0030D5B54C
MNIYEYQGKKILQNFKINIPKGIHCKTYNEAIKAAKYIGGSKWVIKAQIYSGGRGKNNGIKIAKSLYEVEKYTKKMLNKRIITNQTKKKGEIINSILIEEKISFKKEFYISILTDRITQKIIIIISKYGGIEIEKTSLENPQSIYKIYINPREKIKNKIINNIINILKINKNNTNKIKKQIQRIYKAYWKTDSVLLEINPFIITKKNDLIVLDIKFNFDKNALFRHPEILKLQKINKENKNEINASKLGMSYISLKGDIGCLVNGAGLAMATMDIIKYFGGEPANFLDIGGNINKKNIAKSFKIMLKNKKIKIIFINIFGGIIKCDIIAKGLILASKIINIKIPIIIRLKGTNEKKAKNILNKSKLKIKIIDNFEKATKEAILLTKIN